MFEAITDYDTDDRGQVGIGTLIVFIAMVLVAAIAAGVLINTAGVLQSQASDTGSETQEAVANQVEVVHASGTVSGDYVDKVNMTIMKSAGSEAIDLSAMTVQYTSDKDDVTLTYNSTATPASLSSGTTFATENITGAGDSSELLNTDDRVKLAIDVATINGGNGLEGGGSASVSLVDQSGAQFTYGISVPSTFGDKQVVEV
ncbi:archaellin/type IV pilin N-terminal domain-containing protein [Natrinema marinum]|uniref:archaellin/type IV pilin N-terminal domain-containing protein n=1 Tax=Natrinema marinum TaxID=2961598 RepID=UPI0020C8C711|nr:archaellin/type IV pilin N-terminal domain-containing protein [Natrinema marinum]